LGGLIATVSTGLEQEREAGAYVTSIGAHQVEFTHFTVSTATLGLKIFSHFLSPSLAMDMLLIKTSGIQISICDMDFREPKTMEIGWTPRAGASRD